MTVLQNGFWATSVSLCWVSHFAESLRPSVQLLWSNRQIQFMRQLRCLQVNIVSVHWHPFFHLNCACVNPSFCVHVWSGLCLDINLYIWILTVIYQMYVKHISIFCFIYIYISLWDWIPAQGVWVNYFTTSPSKICDYWGEKQPVMSSSTNRREEAEHKGMSHQTELLIQACDSPALWCKVTYIVVSHECVLFIQHAPSFFSSVSISLCPAALSHYHNGVGNDEALIPFVSIPLLLG